jgi:antiphage defense system Thoeris ThsB-like protein
MARQVFFSFDYQRDMWRAAIVRNVGVIEGYSAVGFHDTDIWEKVQKQGDSAVKSLIDDTLGETSVTVVLIGAETAKRSYITYEIERSIAQGNGIVGIRINNIKDQGGRTDALGAIPEALTKIGAPVYDYEYGKIGIWVEAVYRKAHPGPQGA